MSFKKAVIFAVVFGFIFFSLLFLGPKENGELPTTGPGHIRSVMDIGSDSHWGGPLRHYQIVFEKDDGEIVTFVIDKKTPPSVWNGFRSEILFTKSIKFCKATHKVSIRKL